MFLFLYFIITIIITDYSGQHVNEMSIQYQEPNEKKLNLKLDFGQDKTKPLASILFLLFREREWEQNPISALLAVSTEIMKRVLTARQY